MKNYYSKEEEIKAAGEKAVYFMKNMMKYFLFIVVLAIITFFFKDGKTTLAVIGIGVIGEILLCAIAWYYTAKQDRLRDSQ